MNIEKIKLEKIKKEKKNRQTIKLHPFPIVQ